ncbi:MAG: flavodoxin domain-containing protein [Candidatus Omnitrophica bacterium]|nr:flavodoxin domain-containing protein [Candidatus Omnitrophota bacterium]
MNKIEIKSNIFWVGAVDWNMREFHGHTYTTKRGTTYNAYLVVDEKIALVDTVYGPFASELLERIREIIPLEKIDYIIANHVETDHSGALPAITKLCPKAKVLGTAKCKEGLWKSYHEDWDFQIVKTGDKLNLGKRTLNFLEAPMIHWPDSMFTYCPEEKLLMPNDAFGQHYATSERFDDETDICALMDETKKYYANILWPLGRVILKKIEEIQKSGIAIDMIAPSHGIIWRKDPAKALNAYVGWAKNTIQDKVVIVYETMWGSTGKMAKKILEGLVDAGVNAKLFDIAVTDRTEIVSEMLDAKGFLFGSSTHDNNMLPNIAGFLEFIKGIKPRNRVGATFGSYGWAGGAQKETEDIMKVAGIEVSQPALTTQYTPDEPMLMQCYKWGNDFAKKINSPGS